MNKLEIKELIWTPKYGSEFDIKKFENLRLSISEIFKIIRKRKLTDKISIIYEHDEVDKYDAIIFKKSNKLGNTVAQLTLVFEENSGYAGIILNHIYKLAMKK